MSIVITTHNITKINVLLIWKWNYVLRIRFLSSSTVIVADSLELVTRRSRADAARIKELIDQAGENDVEFPVSVRSATANWLEAQRALRYAA